MIVMELKEPRRQGDLIFFPVDEFPSDLTVSTDNVVAVGEGKNHFHKLHGQMQILVPKHPMTVQLEDHEEEVFKFVDAQQELEIRHELPNGKQANHNAWKLPKGKYAVLREREHDIFTEEARVVTD